MRGAFYAVTEILAFLVIATLIGFLLGRWYDALRGRTAGATSRAAAPGAPPPGAEAKLAETEQALATARRRTEEMEKELSMARWQIGTLEDELARRPEPGDAGPE